MEGAESAADRVHQAALGRVDRRGRQIRIVQFGRKGRESLGRTIHAAPP